jgi:hypothetical protein
VQHDTPRPCQNCGATFTQTGRGRPRRWCFECLPKFDGTLAYYRTAERLHLKHQPKVCPACGSPRTSLPCFNGCTQRTPKATPAPLRYAHCLICLDPFVLPIGARGSLRTCSAERCQAVRQGQRRAARQRGGPMVKRKRKAPHHRGTHQTRARLLTVAAYLDPDTKCWRCGRTLQEHKPHHNGKPARWTAGHVRDGEINGELRPEASTCNYSAGASAGNATRAGAVTFRRSRKW